MNGQTNRCIEDILAAISGKPIPFVPITAQEYKDQIIKAGIPPVVADFAFDWVSAINTGELAEQTGDLERLIGRKPTTFRQYLEKYPEVIPELAAVKPIE